MLKTILAIAGISAALGGGAVPMAAPSVPPPGYVHAWKVQPGIPGPITDGYRTGWDVPAVSDGFVGAVDIVEFQGRGLGEGENVGTRRDFAVTRFKHPQVIGSFIHLPTRTDTVQNGAASTLWTGGTSTGNPALGTTPHTVWYCSDVDADVVPISSIYERTGSTGGAIQSRTHAGDWDGPRSIFAFNQCPRLVGIDIWMVYQVHPESPAVAEMFEWRANQVASGRPSVRPPDGADPMSVLCRKANAIDEFPDCRWWVEGFDPTSFDQACAGAPHPEWLSFSWLGPWLAHYVECFFVPIPSPEFDRHGELAESWAGSELALLVDTTTSAVEAFQMSPTCGTLFSGDLPVLGGTVGISTCDWNDWAPAVKVALGVLVSVMFALWGIRFVTGSLSGVFTKKSPEPLDGDEK